MAVPLVITASLRVGGPVEAINAGDALGLAKGALRDNLRKGESRNNIGEVIWDRRAAPRRVPEEKKTMGRTKQTNGTR